ncbi:site-specific integrase [Prosthecochloris sp.]|uniref:tyrosine-type recombinase/integrase n=1 Tax=Prosthecochloris sp. TaxID=290513 RepID=UPI0025E84D53|nr:site-specific integrase [Prosthecochloris sp.]
MKVSILKRPHADNKIGLYLQYSKPVLLPSGKTTRREPLGLFLYGKKRLNPNERQHNRETEKVAETVRAQRQIEVQAGTFGLLKEGSGIMLSGYLTKASGMDGRAYSTKMAWKMMIDCVKEAGIDMPIGNLEAGHCSEFKRWMLARVKSGKWKQSTASHEMSYFRAGLRRAYREGLIQVNLVERFDTIPMGPRAKIEFLTIEELTRLMQTPTKYQGTRKVAFFAALTGLRTSEIRDLEWSDIKDFADGSAVMTYYQRKTKKTKTRYMPSQARELIGNRCTGKVFPHIIPQHHLNTQLRRWALDARIDKHLTMHCMRHTFATLQLAAGTPLHVVSDMLDHSSIKMTEVYAKILDEAVAEATERIRIDAPIEQPAPLRLVKS